jgi:uncharacterized protein YukE
MLETLEKEKFDTLKELADVNVKISEARNELLEIESSKNDYIKLREDETIQRVNKVLKSSEKVIKMAHSNYEEVRTFVNTVSGYKAAVDEGYSTLKDIIKDFNEYQDEWEKQNEDQIHSLSDLEKKVKKDRELLGRERKDVEKFKKSVELERRKVADDRGTLNRAIKRLKSKKI